jgi:RNA polymerase sigma-70 factor (ECF subfamily)
MISASVRAKGGTDHDSCNSSVDRPPRARVVHQQLSAGSRLPAPRCSIDAVGVDDAVLMRRVAAGEDGEALKELYRRFERRVFAFGLRLLGDRGLAGELVQESFLQLWRTADRFDESRGTVAAYVFALARQRAVHLWRRPSSRPLEPECAGAGEVPAPGDATEAMLTRLVVDQALNSLSAAHREVLVLSYRGDLTQAAIAGILSIPLGTVKTRSHYALRALKLALAERGIHGHTPGPTPSRPATCSVSSTPVRPRRSRFT